MFNLSPDPIHQALIMAKEQSVVVTINSIRSTKKAAKVDEKRYLTLNGRDSAIKEGAKLLLLSSVMREEPRKVNGIDYKVQYFWAIDLLRRELVKVSRSSLAGGMGYSVMPGLGEWEENADGKWLILKPKADDPARNSFKSWGMQYIYPGAFKYDNQEISIPRCFVLEVETVEWLFSRNPISTDAPLDQKMAAQNDCSFKPYGARYWSGTACMPSKETIAHIIEDYNLYNPENPIDLSKDGDMFA